jgi:hypothetical protein
MKKLFLILICCFIASSLCLFANEEEINTEFTEEDEALAIASAERGPLRIKDRRVEIGLVNVRAGFANDFLTTSDIFQETLKLNLSELDKGFKINLDLGVTPLYFNYISKSTLWGYGLALGVDAVGAVDLAGSMLTLKEASKDKSDVVGAAFVDVKTSSFFHITNVKAKFNLSVYYPVLYAVPDVFYTFKPSADETELDINYKVRVYTPFSLEDDASFSLSPTPGVDIQLGAEYPLAEVLGLKERFDFLDFIVGIDFLNIPIAPSSMKEYMEISGYVGGGVVDFDDFSDLDKIVPEPETVYGSKKKEIFRPFKMLTWSDWKPFDVVPVNFITTLGFAVNPLYSEPGSVEFGVKARFNLANLFIATIGNGYHDRYWRNSLDLALNLRFFEFFFGVDLRSQDFAKSWSGGGVGANVGFKFGG